MILVPPFKLRGRSGSALNATPILLDVYGARDAKLLLRSMGAGKLTWTQSTTGVVPDIGQTVDLFDGNNVRIFSGTAKRKYIWNSGVKSRWLVTITDAWEGMEQTPLTAAVNDEIGDSTTRPYVVYPTQNLKTSILALLTRMKALGVQFAVGSVSNCFPVTRMTFSKSTGAEALADMLRWIPDASTMVDYSVAGLPTLNVIRRSSMTNITFALGTETDDTLDIEMEDQPELRPLAVEVFSASRDSRNRIVYGSQIAGDAGAEAKRRQTLVASGPENNEVIPGSTYDNAWIRTFTTESALLKIVDSKIADYISKWGEDEFQTAQITVRSETVFNADGDIISESGDYATTPVEFSRRKYIGAAFGWDGKQEPPPWLIQQLGLVKGELKGDLYAKHIQDGSPSEEGYKQRADFNAIVGGEVYWFQGGYYHCAKKISIPVWLIPQDATLFPPKTTTLRAQNSPTAGTTNRAKLSANSSEDPTAYIGARIEWGPSWSRKDTILEYNPNTKIVVLSQLWSNIDKLNDQNYRFTSTPTELISPADFDFVFPPAGLAADLFAAQNFLPWTGKATLGRSAPNIPMPGDKLSATGGDPAWNSAGALIQATDIDLHTRTVDVIIGTPPLTSASTLLDRFRSAARDNLAT